MAYFPDLSAYSYAADRPLSNVRNIGWLAADHGFTRGDVPAPLLAKLVLLAVHRTVQQMRGFHYCGFCDQEDIAIEDGGVTTLLGSAEIWIPAADDGSYYAAPDLIVHYVSRHGYRPPDAFLDALDALDVAAWDPEPVAAVSSRPR
jgi:hypothetical protein